MYILSLKAQYKPIFTRECIITLVFCIIDIVNQLFQLPFLVMNKIGIKINYEMKLPFFHVLTFNFLTLHLRKRNWRDFIDSNNPVAAALLSQMGYTESERIEVKKEFWRMLVRMQIDPARQYLIYGFFESYLKLTDTEEEIFMTEIGKLQEADKIFELTNSYVERGKEIGKEEGKEIGRKEGKELGKTEAKMKVALRMLKKGWDIDLISEVTRF